MKEIMIYIAAGYLVLVNLIGFAAMGMDKAKAKAKAREEEKAREAGRPPKYKSRIRERTLFLWAIIGGSIGSILGMYAFRHKTKHWYFRIGMPVILLLQIAAVILVWYLRTH